MSAEDKLRELLRVDQWVKVFASHSRDLDAIRLQVNAKERDMEYAIIEARESIAKLRELGVSDADLEATFGDFIKTCDAFSPELSLSMKSIT